MTQINFPLKGVVTKEIIEKSEIYDAFNCIGVNFLRSLLPPIPEGYLVIWSMDSGGVYEGWGNNNRVARFRTLGWKDMMYVTAGTEIELLTISKEEEEQLAKIFEVSVPEEQPKLEEVQDYTP